MKVFISLQALMKLSARFFLYHGYGFERTYGRNGIEKHRSDLLNVITFELLADAFVRWRLRAILLKQNKKRG